MQEDLAFAGVLRQRAMLANGSIRARDLVALHLDRIERLNPALNAFVSVYADSALREANHAQQSLDAGDTRPLLGIPFGVKDEHDLAGEVTSLGTGATTRVASRDSEVVRILRAAGAITSLWSFIGQPAASIPAGFDNSGLPIGTQLLARRMQNPA